MPTVKILMWNTQHLNHQNERKPMSEAYEEKLDALLTTLATLKPEIVALFEVGTTGNPNLRLVEDLKGAYEMKVSLSLEGGLRKGTTLGSMVFVRNDIAADYVEPFELPLGEKAIRATLLLSDKSGNVFAFCHANASKAALEQVQDDIKLLGGFQGEGIKRLVFFGGDLNTHASDAPESITLPGHDKMYRCEPGNAGFTHISIRSSVALAKQLYQQEKKKFAGADATEREPLRERHDGHGCRGRRHRGPVTAGLRLYPRKLSVEIDLPRVDIGQDLERQDKELRFRRPNQLEQGLCHGAAGLSGEGVAKRPLPGGVSGRVPVRAKAAGTQGG